MTFQAKPRCAANAAGVSDLSLLSRIDGQGNNPPHQNLQARKQLRRRYLVTRLHALGPSPLSCFLAEIESGARFQDTLEAYARIDPQFVRALGGADFPPFLWEIEGGRR